MLLLPTGTYDLEGAVHFIFCGVYRGLVLVLLLFVKGILLLGCTVVWCLVVFRLCYHCNGVLFGCVLVNYD